VVFENVESSLQEAPVLVLVNAKRDAKVSMKRLH